MCLNDSFEDNNLNMLARESGIKESICVKLEQLFLNRGGGRRFYLSPTYKFSAEFPSIATVHTWAHLGSVTHRWS